MGYYVNTYYEDEARQAEPPKDVDFDGLCRNVLVEKPKVTRLVPCSTSLVRVAEAQQVQQPMGQPTFSARLYSNISTREFV